VGQTSTNFPRIAGHALQNRRDVADKPADSRAPDRRKQLTLQIPGGTISDLSIALR
jgi:hypothetical protein